MTTCVTPLEKASVPRGGSHSVFQELAQEKKQHLALVESSHQAKTKAEEERSAAQAAEKELRAKIADGAREYTEFSGS